ncbi:MAG: putative lipid II flippase FtsW [Gammaproteobacteria bacterium]|nr:MAG: putative lipid II flippase FtsW [Gammaproteobacteria bacterium]
MNTSNDLSFSAPSSGAMNRQSVLFLCAASLVCIGFVVVFSASLDIAESLANNPLYFVKRQGTFIILGLMVSFIVYQVPMDLWQKNGVLLFLVSFLLLVIVLIPFIGHSVNGSRRWIPLGVTNFQPSEIVKVFMLIYLAGYIVRKKVEMETLWSAFLKPMGVLLSIIILLLMEPDFGSVVVLVLAYLSMLFLGGVKVSRFFALVGVCVVALGLLAFSQPYRVARLKSFLEPWEHQFSSGYQLTQSLIAFGRGEYFGVGLGNGVQKLFYLPEAHTDFVFAVLAEELGLVGNLLVVGLFLCLFITGLMIGRNAEKVGRFFSAQLVYGLSVLMAVQALFNLGVNMGLLPTKGLTLPLMSYGGSSMLVSFFVLAIIARVERETREIEAQMVPLKKPKKTPKKSEKNTVKKTPIKTPDSKASSAKSEKQAKHKVVVA